MSKKAASRKPSAAPAKRSMSKRTAIIVIVGCVALAGLIFALTTGGKASGAASGGTAVAGLGTGKPTLYEFSTET